MCFLLWLACIAQNLEEQVANAGAQKWVASSLPPYLWLMWYFIMLKDYCAPKINYADVRKRVSYAFAEKANEIADAIAVVQSLSKEGTALLDEIKTQCP